MLATVRGRWSHFLEVEAERAADTGAKGVVTEEVNGSGSVVAVRAEKWEERG